MGREHVTVVGITTEQATANLVPTIQSGADRYVAIDSSVAEREGWGVGLAEVLRDRGVRHERIVLQERHESGIDALREAVSAGLERLGFARRPVVWLFGGGQKTHQLVFYDLFVRRTSEGIADAGLYSDPRTRRTMRLKRRSDGRLVESQVDLDARLTVAEVIRSFNHTVGRSKDLPQSPDASEYDRFRRDAAYRRDWFRRIEDSSKKRAEGMATTVEDLHARLVAREAAEALRGVARGQLSQWLGRVPSAAGAGLGPAPHLTDDHVKQVVNVVFRSVFDRQAWLDVLDPRPLSSPVETPFGTFRVFSTYFEHLLVHRVAKWIQERRPAGIVEARVNVEVFDRGGNPVAEHDVLLATASGTLVSLDAKTFNVERKDLDARRLNLQGASGRYGTFVPVIPWFLADAQAAVYPPELQELPFRLARHNSPFVVVSETDRTFWIRKAGEPGGMERGAPGEPGSVRCTTLEDYLGGLVSERRVGTRQADAGGRE